MRRKNVWGNIIVFFFLLIFLMGCSKPASGTVQPGDYDVWSEEESTIEDISDVESSLPEEDTLPEETATPEETDTAEETDISEEDTLPEDADMPEETTTPEETQAMETFPIVEHVSEEDVAPPLTKAQRLEIMRGFIAEEFPGIVCWGDSLTFGYAGNGESYPATLSRLISERIIDGIEVVNNGIPIETTHTIMARASSWAIYAEGFTIPSGTESVPMRAFFEGGMYSNLASNGGQGLNPVTIAGIKGELNAINDRGDYYFHRLEPGAETVVKYGELIHPISKELYKNYVNIYFMGQNGCFNTPEDLISQYERLLSVRGSDRYIIIGLTTGNNVSRGELSSKMAQRFGDKYIDMRIEIIQKGPELVGLERRQDDINCLEDGRIMDYLLADEVHFNEYGYRAMGMIIYDRMKQLGYFDNLINIVAQYK